MPNWTESQQDAINARHGSVLVSAAAGSGKTAVLVQRVIERITDQTNPTDADKLLVVTFTRAAAAEMRERIQKALNALIRLDPSNPYLQRQQMLLPSAHISTIHSFCNTVVKDNFYNLDISPGFRLADETELELMKKEAVNTAIDKLYESSGSEYADFVNVLGSAKTD